MKLSDEQIKKITKGALLIEQEEGFLRFFRLPKETVAEYSRITEEKRLRALSSSGVRLEFYTDSSYLKIGYLLAPGSSQPRGAFDVWVDGILYASKGENVIDGKRRSIEFSLPTGKKRIDVYFPTLAQTYISSIEVSDHSSVEAVGEKPLALFFGDSITQGYTTYLPSLNYVSRLSRKMGLDFYNFAIGGDVFNDFVTKPTLPRRPEYVFVSYGTNDWGHNVLSQASMKKNMRVFFNSLCEKYPTSRIVAILPLWRSLEPGFKTVMGSFDELFPLMREALRDYPKVEIIDGRELVPHIHALFADGYLHPNDTGFEFYADALYEKMSK